MGTDDLLATGVNARDGMINVLEDYASEEFAKSLALDGADRRVSAELYELFYDMYIILDSLRGGLGALPDKSMTALEAFRKDLDEVKLVTNGASDSELVVSGRWPLAGC